MKKVLSFLFVAGFATSMFSQTVWTETFESYNVGNLGTQGGWARDGGGTASWTKVANIDATHGKSFQLGSTAANADGVWHYHDTKWSTKTSGNNIFVLEFDYYTGAGGDGVGVAQIYDVDAGYAEPMEIGWDPEGGYIYLADESGDGILLDENPTTNTWYHIKASYDTTTGGIKAQINNGEVQEFAGIPGYEPTEFDALLYSVTTSGFDNITVTATNTDPFMAVSDVTKKSKISVYPNPATNVLNIKSDSKIAEVSIYDAAGKIVKTTAETSINVENLAKGSYIVSIKYADGSKESTKVIKK